MEIRSTCLEELLLLGGGVKEILLLLLEVGLLLQEIGDILLGLYERSSVRASRGTIVVDRYGLYMPSSWGQSASGPR